jgi:hypothetical protein
MTTTIQLPNGRTAISFVPEDSKELAIVPLSVIQRLAKDLPNAPLSSHKHQLKEQILASSTLEDMVQICESFVDFHRTVNLIAEYKPAPLPDEAPADLMR